MTQDRAWLRIDGVPVKCQVTGKTTPEEWVQSTTGGAQNVLRWFLRGKSLTRERNLIPNHKGATEIVSLL